MPSLIPERTPASIDTTDMRHAGKDLLSLALMDARNHSLHLLAQFEQRDLEPGGAKVVPGRDSALWLAGHIAWLAEYWIGRNPQRARGPACPKDGLRLASIDPLADQWFDPVLAPASLRQGRGLPDYAAVRAYLLDTLESTLELLDKAPEDDDALHFFRMALFHEDMRGEELIVQAQASGVPLKLGLPPGVVPRAPMLVPGGRWMLGSQPGGFVFDVEKWAHEIDVPDFEIDAQPVNWAQFLEFVDDGGYDRPEFWLPAGWGWLEYESALDGRRAPRYVDQIGSASGAVMQTHFGRPARMSGSQSVMHVSWWEADAWARWAGRRLPTEVEWDMAVHTAARRGLRWGDVREWTASSLRPWPGFVPDAWTLGTDFEATPFFSRARVQRGASFATRARMKHPKLRSFAMPERDEGFVGFRTCSH